MNCLRKVLIVVVALMIFVPVFGDRPPERIAREHLATGDSLFTAREFVRAIDSYRQSLNIFREIANEITPFEAEIRDVLFKLYAAGGNARNFEIAVRYGEELLKYDPANEAIVSNLARIYRVGLQNIPGAIAVWRRFDEQFNNFTAKREIGDLYARMNDTTNAIAWFNRALEQSRDADLLQRIASLYINANQPNRAIRIYEDFLATDPPARERGITLRNMGRLYQDLNNIPMAIQRYEAFLEIDWDRNIALWLVSQFFDAPNFAKANQYIQAMLARNANDQDAIYFRALIAHAEGRFAEARTDFQRLVNHPTYGASSQQFIRSIDSLD